MILSWELILRFQQDPKEAGLSLSKTLALAIAEEIQLVCNEVENYKAELEAVRNAHDATRAELVAVRGTLADTKRERDDLRDKTYMAAVRGIETLKRVGRYLRRLQEVGEADSCDEAVEGLGKLITRGGIV